MGSVDKKNAMGEPGRDKESKNAISEGKCLTTLLEIGRFENIQENVVKYNKNKQGGRL